MTVNNSGVLRKEYFIAYLKLVIHAKQVNVNEAKEYTWKHFFHQNKVKFGEATYHNFELAYKELMRINIKTERE
ncbi:hypothetical protein OEV98_03090 [Caldibacillus lycopersici]|uniref:Uncharacterized protein n=1 Tax=Perspicuibacillus lycopersici TaxID=1325689 RepID=A0AAE3IQ81_9BACI|nr:hypothetical protein [Perspicuibacillus lycopersici]MCU9612548.1 hypothetical protein [Perspicuibacillus lycopersici]